MKYQFERTIFDYFNYFNRMQDIKPLILGGLPGASGGSGGHPGGFLGFLPQDRVAYDTTEASLSGFVSASAYNPSGILINASLVDNLNHIRYRLGVVENLGFSAGTISVEESQVLVASGVTILNFTGSVDASSTGPGEVTITVSGSSTDEKTKVSSDDTTSNYLENKITAGSNVSVTVLNPGGNEQVQISATGSGLSDEQVKISSNDTTTNYLESKLAAGTNISLAVLNEGGNEQIQITASGGVASDEKAKVSANDTTANYLESKIIAGDNVTVTVLNDGSNEQLEINATASGTGTPINASDEGIVVASGITSLNFVGPTVRATAVGTDVTVTISGLSAPFVGAKGYLTSNVQLSTSTGWQTYSWNTVEYESPDTTWDGGSPSRLYSRETAYYVVTGQATFSGALPTTERFQLGVFRNESLVANIWEGYYVNTSGYRTLQAVYHGLVNNGEYLSLRIVNGAGTQPYTISGVNNTFLAMHKIQGQVSGQTANPLAVSACMASGYTTANNETETPVVMTSEIYDTGSFWSSGSQYTIPETGYYHIVGYATWESVYYHGVTPFQIKTGIRKNGSVILAQKWDWNDVNTGGARAEGLTTNITCDSYLQSGDYIELVVWHSKGSTASNIIRPNDYNTAMMLHKIQ